MAGISAGPNGDSALEGVYPWMEDRPDDRKLLRAALLLAVAVHLWLFVVHWPDMGRRHARVIEKPPITVFEVKPFRIAAKRPRRHLRPPVRRVPLPDITPDEPEVLRPVEEPIQEIPPDDLYIGAEVPPPPPAPTPAPEVVEVGQVIPPRVTHRVDPRYPPSARAIRLQGNVVLDLIIGRDGTVEDIEVVESSFPPFAKSAREAVRQWRFEPSTYRGRPVKVHYRLTIRFRLQ